MNIRVIEVGASTQSSFSVRGLSWKKVLGDGGAVVVDGRAGTESLDVGGCVGAVVVVASYSAATVYLTLILVVCAFPGVLPRYLPDCLSPFRLA